MLERSLGLLFQVSAIEQQGSFIVLGTQERRFLEISVGDMLGLGASGNI